MRRLAVATAPRRVLPWVVSGALLAGGVACSPAAQPGPGARVGGVPAGPVNPAPVSEADFGPNTYQLLLSGERDSKRLELLAGVVRHQLDRAGARFGSNKSAGMAALTGALYLVRVGELRPEMLTRAAPALRAGSAEVARVGDEGRSFAYYGMLQRILPEGAERRDADLHLAALAKWSAATGTTGPMQAAGNRQRAAINRALVEPTPQSRKEAVQATLQWMKRALDFNASEMPIRSNMEREEAIEAYRAVRAGGATLVALYLRDGDARGALDTLADADLLRVVPPGLTERLERAASDDDAAAWADLFTLFDGSDAADRPETSIDPEVSRAGAWGAALALFRSEPRSMRGAAPLSMKLVELGMAEVAPLVLGPAVGERPSTEELSWALSLVLRAVVAEDEIGDLPAARRTFAAAAPILAVAESKAYVGKLRPSAGRVRYVMGALETRAGELSRALPHVEAAVKTEPTMEAYSMLAGIFRQRNEAPRALDALDRLIAIAQRSGERVADAEAHLTKFEIHRDRGESAPAQKALVAALGSALDARQVARNGAAQARAERVLARVLEHFGALSAAQRATERAYEASRSDARQLTATVLDASRRALTQGDITLARRAVRQALDAHLDGEDLIYVALWLRLLETSKGVASDGTVEEALAAIDESGGWAAKLASWARGKLTDAQLVAAARSRVQRTEAEFYAAMSGKQRAETLKELAKVASSEAIELVEVTIARDLVAQHDSKVEVRLPPNVQVP